MDFEVNISVLLLTYSYMILCSAMRSYELANYTLVAFRECVAWAKLHHKGWSGTSGMQR
jgi:hypothetical protein